MKIRQFYPRQILRRLRGRRVDELSTAEKHALWFFMKRGCHYGYDLTVLADGTIQLLGTRSVVVLSGPKPTKAKFAGLDAGGMYAGLKSGLVIQTISAGGTSAGKVTLTSAIVDMFPSKERLVTIDDTSDQRWSQYIESLMRLDPV